MENKIQLTKEIILNHQFTPNVKGYDPSEVDDFLDRIIEDYKTFEKFEKESKEYIQSLETENRRIKEAYKAVEVDNGKMKARLDGIKEGDHVTKENMELLQKISKYERALYAKGIDPRKL
ncbi:MAG: DivIVA domain-containing protein [Candidatus Enteromonas sp.]|jgi:DivIVA domain-containing protein|nr:DivIVA domain-containing protein [Bacilli bacterium]MEE3298790.1 DivIVA domain-containing protein [Candidatus Enteromonas sp.]MBQ2052447.1 DivIVA domain-containing protein [Bacilli bacterium]MBQ4183160.1 DivIVA domain-containing protein [Bacilli bacterium]MCR5091860.1 DivIVA domain-containing protein [Bacilli bacterium]